MSAVVTSGGGVHELANAREGKFSTFSTGEVTRDARMERKTADDRTPRQHSDVHRSIWSDGVQGLRDLVRWSAASQ